MQSQAIRRIQGMILLSLVALPLGCKQSSSSTSATNPAPNGQSTVAPTRQPPAQATVVELSDPKVTLENGTTLRYQVKYRFTKGQPKPEHWYACNIEFEPARGAGLKRIQGKDLKVEGSIEETLRLLKSGAKEYHIYLSEGPGMGGPFRQISNDLKGPIR